MYAMIENVGECPVEGFTTLGVSTTRVAGKANTIGQFGSGLKHGIMTMLRSGNEVIAFTGEKSVVFQVEPMEVNDGLIKKEYGQVVAHIDGKREKLSFVIEHGALDWDDIRMAMREFVANAIDRTIREGKDLSCVQIVKDCPEKAVVGEKGKTRLFVKMNPTVREYLNNIGQYFLHFHSSTGDKLIDNVEHKNARFYKKGVFVRELKQPSLFHYNIGALKIDESRNSDDYNCRWSAAASLWSLISDTQLRTLFTALMMGTPCIENSFSEIGLAVPIGMHKRIVQAWKETTHDAIMVSSTSKKVIDYLVQKGHNVCGVPACYYTNLRHVPGLKTDVSYTNENGHEVFPASTEMLQAVEKVWNLCKSYTLNGRNYPKIMGFMPLMDAHAQVWGEYHPDTKTVYLHKDLQGSRLETVALEEVVHHITGATDMSRDFQEYLLRLIQFKCC